MLQFKLHRIYQMIRYETCRVGEDGIYSCGHEHESVAEAMRCSVPDGGEFIRACESGVYRSLNDREFLDFSRGIEGHALEVARMGLRKERRHSRGEKGALLSALFFLIS